MYAPEGKEILPSGFRIAFPDRIYSSTVLHSLILQPSFPQKWQVNLLLLDVFGVLGCLLAFPPLNCWVRTSKLVFNVLRYVRSSDSCFIAGSGVIPVVPETVIIAPGVSTVLVCDPVAVVDAKSHSAAFWTSTIGYGSSGWCCWFVIAILASIRLLVVSPNPWMKSLSCSWSFPHPCLARYLEIFSKSL